MSNSSNRSSDTNPEFVIPGQQPVRFPNHPLMNHGHPHHSSKSPMVPAAGGMPLTPQYYIPPATGVLAAANVLTSSVHSRRASDVATTESTNIDTTTGPPIVPKIQRRFSLAQALSTTNSSESSGLMRSLSKNKSKDKSGINPGNISEDTINENVVERKESIIAPLPSDKSPMSDRPLSPTYQSSGRKGSTTSIGSTSSKATSSNGSNSKRRQSRTMAFFSHRLGSEAIPDMKSLSISSSSSSSSRTNSGIKNLLHGHDKKPPSETYRLVVLGGSRVGKTAIVSRFLYNTFPEAHSATVEELHRADYEVKGLGIVGVEILDTSGSFPFPAMQRLAISSGHAFILVYSIDDKESFEEVSRLRELVLSVKSSSNHNSQDTPSTPSSNAQSSQNLQQKSMKKLFSSSSSSRTNSSDNDTTNSAMIDTSSSVPLVIVANKSDLDTEDGVRVVGTEMAECECIDWDVAFVEASARTGDNVMNIFHKLLLQAHLKGILKSAHGEKSSEQESSPTKGLLGLKVSKVAKVSNRRRSSLPVNELFHGRVPIFGGGAKEGKSYDAKNVPPDRTTSPTTSSGGDHSSSGRSSCALS